MIKNVLLIHGGFGGFAGAVGGRGIGRRGQ
jgi:hypothetical protein